MADDSDRLDGPSTQKFQAPTGQRPDRSDDFRTAPLDRVHDETSPVRANIALPDEETGYLPISNDELPIPAPADDRTSVASISDAALRRRGSQMMEQPALHDDGTLMSGLPAPGVAPSGPAPRIHQNSAAPRAPRAPLPPEQLPPEQLPPRPMAPPKRRKEPSGVSARAVPIVAARAPANPRSPRTRALHAKLAGGATATLWLLGTFGVTLSLWPTPAKVAAWAALGITPSLFAAAAAAFQRGQRPQFSDLRLLSGAVGLALGLLLVVPIAWQFGPIRGVARGLAADTPEVQRAVLLDRDEILAAKECARLVPDVAKPAVSPILVETLAARPEVVRSCLKRAPEVSALLSEAFVSTWYDEMMAGAETTTACGIAQSLTHLDLPPGEAQTRLMACVVGARPPVQNCCGEALAGGSGSEEWIATSLRKDRYLPDANTGAALLKLTFGRELTPTQEQWVKDSGFADPEAQRAGVVLACAAAKEGAELGAAFAEILPADCPVNVGELPATAAAWVEACELSEDRLIRRRADPSEALCTAARAMGLAHAATAASAEVHEATTQRLSIAN